MSITFSKGGLSDLTIPRGRMFPYLPEEIDVHQDRYLTESNNAKVINYGTNLKLMTIQVMYLTKDNYDGAVNGIKTWLSSSTINWSANSFTMVDEVGVSWTVRYWADSFSMPVAPSGRYNLELTLKVE